MSSASDKDVMETLISPLPGTLQFLQASFSRAISASRSTDLARGRRSMSRCRSMNRLVPSVGVSTAS
jgi:hypothetical protein